MMILLLKHVIYFHKLSNDKKNKNDGEKTMGKKTGLVYLVGELTEEVKPLIRRENRDILKFHDVDSAIRDYSHRVSNDLDLPERHYITNTISELDKIWYLQLISNSKGGGNVQ